MSISSIFSGVGASDSLSALSVTTSAASAQDVSAAVDSDNGSTATSVSLRAKHFQKLDQLSRSAPNVFKTVTGDIATQLQAQAQQGDGQTLTALADKFQQASQTGSLSPLQSRAHGRHHDTDQDDAQTTTVKPKREIRDDAPPPPTSEDTPPVFLTPNPISSGAPTPLTGTMGSPVTASAQDATATLTGTASASETSATAEDASTPTPVTANPIFLDNAPIPLDNAPETATLTGTVTGSPAAASPIPALPVGDPTPTVITGRVIPPADATAAATGANTLSASAVAAVAYRWSSGQNAALEAKISAVIGDALAQGASQTATPRF